jgi:hypothetical protein
MNKNFTTDNGSKMFSYTNSTNYLTDYSVALLMKWHRQDPVSVKEIDRNDSVYKCQNNRNPFVDFPDLAEYIWGNQTSTSFDINTILSAYSPDYVPLDTEGSDKTDYTKYGVTWLANGVTLLTDSIFKNHKPATLPDAPLSCSTASETFMGWSASAINGTTQTAPADLFRTPADAPAVNADMTFHAVFAHEEQGQGQGNVTATASFTTNDGYKRGDKVTSATAGKVTITFAKGSASTAATFYTEIRCYAGSTITLSGATMSRVEFMPGPQDNSNPITANVGTMNDLVWTGSTSNIIFTIGGDSKSRGFSAIKVTYDDNTTVFTYSDYLTHCGAAGIENQPSGTSNRKLLIDGRLYILVGETLYDITGQRVQ